MKNYIQPGNVIDVVAPQGGYTSGQVVVVCSLAGIAAITAAEGDVCPVNLTGVYQLAKAAGVISQGAKLYWDADNSNITTTAAGNTFIGFAWADEINGATTVNVKLEGGADTGVAANQAAVATADGSDAATTQALANALKTSVNGILTKLKAAGLMAPDA